MPAMFTYDRNGSECAPPYWIEIESGRKKLKADGSKSWIVEGNKTKWEWNSNFYIASQIGDASCYMTPLNLSAQSWIKIEMNQYKHFDKVQNEFIPTLLPSIVNLNILIQYFFEIKINGFSVEKEENIKPLKFYDVEIWAAHKHSFLSAANATIRNIKYNSEGNVDIEMNLNCFYQ